MLGIISHLSSSYESFHRTYLLLPNSQLNSQKLIFFSLSFSFLYLLTYLSFCFTYIRILSAKICHRSSLDKYYINQCTRSLFTKESLSFWSFCFPPTLLSVVFVLQRTLPPLIHHHHLTADSTCVFQVRSVSALQLVYSLV